MTAADVLGPQDLNTSEFDCLIHLPREPYTVLVLRDASWSHRGRWHLSGVLHASAEDKFYLSTCDSAQILYQDGSREIVNWYTVKGNLVYQLTEVHGRFGAYVQAKPRYPRGRGDERLAGIEVTAAVVPRLHEIVNKHLPGLTDQQRKSWLVAALQGFRDEEVGAATRRLARQGADALDHLADLRRLVSSAIDTWVPGDDVDQTRVVLDKVERLLDLSEKGLPLE